jgi:hypothetical protein
MDPNVKLMIKELVTKVCEEIRECFTVHEVITNSHLNEFTLVDQRREERVFSLESATAEFDRAFTIWKPDVESLLTSIKLELTKLNTYFNRDVKMTSSPKPGALPIISVTVNSSTSGPADGPNGNHNTYNHHDCGFGRVFTHIHDLVTAMMFPPLPNFPSCIEKMLLV